MLHDMPSKEREKIIFDIPESERERIEKEMCVMRAAREKQPHVARRMIMEQYNDLPRLKEPVVRQYLKDLLVDGEIGTNPQTKVLLFYHHREMRNILVNEVEKAELEYIEINGDVPSGKRQPLVDTFQTDPKCRVAILSITAAGTGLNMHGRILCGYVRIVLDTFANGAGRGEGAPNGCQMASICEIFGGRTYVG